MDANNRQCPIPLRAQLADIEIVGDLIRVSRQRPDHYVEVYVDDLAVLRSEKKLSFPAPRWVWPEGHQLCILFHPSSIIKIVILQQSKMRIMEHIIGEHTCQLIELFENNTPLVFEDKTGTRLSFKIKINIFLVSEPEDTSKNIVQASAGVSAFGSVLQLTKNIMDTVTDPNPVMKASLVVMSSVYGAARRAKDLQATIQDLAKGLGDVLHVAKEYPDLLFTHSRTDVIEDISRMSLNVASLIHKSTRPWTVRILPSMLFDNMKSHIRKFIAVRIHNNLRALLANRADLVPYRQISASSTVTPYRGPEGVLRHEFLDRSSYSKAVEEAHSDNVNVIV